MTEDSGLVRAARIIAFLLGVTLLVLGVIIFDGAGFESLLPGWGWIIGAVVGGGTMGAGLGFGVTAITGDNRVFEKLRSMGKKAPELPSGDGEP